MFQSSTRRKAAAAANNYTAATRSQFVPRSAAGQPEPRSNQLARLVTFFAALVLIIVFLSWAVGVRDENRPRLGGGVRVVARDWDRHESVKNKGWRGQLARDRSEGLGKAVIPEEGQVVLVSLYLPELQESC